MWIKPLYNPPCGATSHTHPHLTCGHRKFYAFFVVCPSRSTALDSTVQAGGRVLGDEAVAPTLITHTRSLSHWFN